MSTHFYSLPQTKWPVIKLFSFLPQHKRDDFAARVYRHFQLFTSHRHSPSKSLPLQWRDKKCRFTRFSKWCGHEHISKSLFKYRRSEMKLKAQPRHHNRHFFSFLLLISRFKHAIVYVGEVVIKFFSWFAIFFRCYNQFISS